MKSTKEIVLRRLRSIVRQESQLSIGPDSLLKEDLGLDSMTLVGLFAQLSDDLKIDLLSIADTDLLQIATVEDLIGTLSN